MLIFVIYKSILDEERQYYSEECGYLIRTIFYPGRIIIFRPESEYEICLSAALFVLLICLTSNKVLFIIIRMYDFL